MADEKESEVWNDAYNVLKYHGFIKQKSGVSMNMIDDEESDERDDNNFKRGWNAAIDAAAKYFEDNIDDPGLTSKYIRKLQK